MAPAQKSYREGFTLVELLLVIAIFSTLIATGTVSYRNFQRGQAITQAAETLRTNLRFAQSNAFAGVKHGSCVDTDGNSLDLTGWFVIFSGNSYTLQVFCSPEIIVYRTVDLPAGVTLSSSGGHILFQPINRGVLFTGGGNETTVTLTNGSQDVAVMVRRLGDIL